VNVSDAAHLRGGSVAFVLALVVGGAGVSAAVVAAQPSPSDVVEDYFRASDFFADPTDCAWTAYATDRMVEGSPCRQVRDDEGQLVGYEEGEPCGEPGLRLLSETVAGDEARVEVEVTDGVEDRTACFVAYRATVRLVRDDDEWKVDEFG
jgi:hypothetical protein